MPGSFLLPRGRVRLLCDLSGLTMQLKRLCLLLSSFTAYVAALKPIGELESGLLVSLFLSTPIECADWKTS